MIYLVIALIISQFIHIIYYQKILYSLKRKYKGLDSQIRNLGQWVITNHQAMSHQLERINKVVSGGHMQVSHKENLEKIKMEDIQQYYAILLQELEQLDSNITQVRKQTILHSRVTHTVDTSLFKKKMMNRLKDYTRLNKSV